MANVFLTLTVYRQIHLITHAMLITQRVVNCAVSSTSRCS